MNWRGMIEKNAMVMILDHGDGDGCDSNVDSLHHYDESSGSDGDDIDIDADADANADANADGDGRALSDEVLYPQPTAGQKVPC